MALTFNVSDVELANLRRKLKEHVNKTACRNIDNRYKDPMEGATLVYTFSQTGIGYRIQVVCLCEERFDISDYSNW